MGIREDERLKMLMSLGFSRQSKRGTRNLWSSAEPVGWIRPHPHPTSHALHPAGLVGAGRGCMSIGLKDCDALPSVEQRSTKFVECWSLTKGGQRFSPPSRSAWVDSEPHCYKVADRGRCVPLTSFGLQSSAQPSRESNVGGFDQDGEDSGRDSRRRSSPLAPHADSSPCHSAAG